MSEIARTRADVDFRASGDPKAPTMDRFPSDCLVEIQEELNGWYKVKPVRLKNNVSGYVPKAALIFPEPNRPAVFPTITRAGGRRTGYSVSPALKLTDFQDWKTNGGKPSWIPQDSWADLDDKQQTSFRSDMLTAIQDNQARWDTWVADVTANNRLADAIMNEWIVTLQGGREVYTIRDHTVYEQPVENGKARGNVLRGQTMRWTGKVQGSKTGSTMRNFYEVAFYRMSREMIGWFRADLVSEYNFPLAENDPQINTNAKNVFDLSTPILVHPQDDEITEAKKNGFTGAQYIDIFKATNQHVRHFSLCGEFCVAALARQNVIPVLKAWIDSKYERVFAILKNPKEGTGAWELQKLLTTLGIQSEMYNSIPTTLDKIKERLSQGEFAICGCGITSGGVVKANGGIRHWVVLEDVLPVGNSGWVRVYNPFHNQEEVYEYNMFMMSHRSGAGLWVTP